MCHMCMVQYVKVLINLFILHLPFSKSLGALEDEFEYQYEYELKSDLGPC